MAGKTIGIDPGHNGQNYTNSALINQPVFNGREEEACDTTGTETDAGYPEAQFNFNVSMYLDSDLTHEGAKVVMTRTTNDGIGPCITNRTSIINAAHADVAIDIHADGGPSTGRGFTILEPVTDSYNSNIIAASDAFALDLLRAYQSGTGMPTSNYDGIGGLTQRDDLAGLNLTTVPKVLIECGNMRNSTDAALLISPTFQQQAALTFAVAITNYLT